MNIKVILFGTLRKSFSRYNQRDGMEVEIPEGSTVEDLISYINLSVEKIGIVSMNGHLVKAGIRLQENSVVRIFQPIFGG